MYKEVKKQHHKFASKMGLKGEVKPGALMDRAEGINSGKVKLKKKHMKHLEAAEKHLKHAEMHLKAHHKTMCKTCGEDHKTEHHKHH